MEHFGSTPYTKSFSKFSVRTIFSFVLAVLMTAFLWAAIVDTTSVNAQTGTAEWEGSALRYDGRLYTEAGKTQSNQFPGISADVAYFISESAPANGQQGSSAPRDIFIIYLGSGVDPPAATDAQHIQFVHTPSTKTYAAVGTSQPITITGDYNQGGSSCTIEGVGWFVCQISSFLATGMDAIFEGITGFMEVQPLITSQDSGIYIGWNIMRNIANVAFIISFLIIVYAQLTGAMAGTYGIKKLLPRLIVAAVLVNISYIICALAVDLSNILGYSLQGAFIDMRDQMFQMNNNTWNDSEMLSWESVTGFLLSGGTAAGAGLIALKTGVSFAPGAIYLLLPALAGLLLAILVVLLVLAARQAIIIILVILAPLAFVAYLLPNTEGLFDKWRKLFMTMLIFFPAFAVVFGGAQLAGGAIIQSANSINVVILGMIVQVAPLVITPFLFKFSGSLLGRIAGMVNDPNKGLIDRTRKFSQGRAERARDRWQGNLNHKGQPLDKPISRARRLSRWAGSGQRKFEATAASAKTAADTSWQSSKAYRKINDNTAQIDTDKETVAARNSSLVEAQRINPGSGLHSRTKAMETEKQGLDAATTRTKVMVETLRADDSSDLHLNTLRTEQAKAISEQMQARTARVTEEYKSGKLVLTGEKGAILADMKEANIQMAAEKQGQASAHYEVQRGMSNAMNAETVAGDALRKIAGGIGGVVGETRARAQALSTLNKLDDDALKGNIDLLKATAAQAGTTFKNYSQDIVTNAIAGRMSVNGKSFDSDQLKAALQLQAQEKNISLFEEARGSLNLDQSLVSEIISMNVGDFKAAGGFHLQARPELNRQNLGSAFDREMSKARIETLAGVSPENLANLKAGWVEDLARNPTRLADDIRIAQADGKNDKVLEAYMALKKALSNDSVLAKLDNRDHFLRDIEKTFAEGLSKSPTENPWD